MALHTSKLLPFLDESGAPYELIHHRLDYTAQRTAADTHTTGRAFAKTVVLAVGEGHALAVLPAHRKVDFAKARELLGEEVTLAAEEDVADLFPDCEVGAEPPFGNLYGLPTYVSPELAGHESVTFNAGTHHEVIRMRYDDYARLAQPRAMDLSWQH